MKKVRAEYLFSNSAKEVHFKKYSTEMITVMEFLLNLFNDDDFCSSGNASIETIEDLFLSCQWSDFGMSFRNR